MRSPHFSIFTTKYWLLSATTTTVAAKDPICLSTALAKHHSQWNSANAPACVAKSAESIKNFSQLLITMALEEKTVLGSIWLEPLIKVRFSKQHQQIIWKWILPKWKIGPKSMYQCITGQSSNYAISLGVPNATTSPRRQHTLNIQNISIFQIIIIMLLRKEKYFLIYLIFPSV